MGFFSDLEEPIQAEAAPEEVPAFKKGFFSDLPEQKNSLLNISKAPTAGISDAKRMLGRHAKTIGTAVLGLPGDIASGVGQLGNWAAGSPKTEEELLPLTEGPLTSKGMKKWVEEKFPTLAPRNEEEHKDEENLSLLTSLVTPLPLGKTKALQIGSKKFAETLKAGKALGLTPQEMTLLVQGEAKQGLLGKFAGKTKALKQALEITQNKLGDIRSHMGELASKIPLSEAAESHLAEQLTKFIGGTRRTLAASPQKEAVTAFAQKAFNNLTEQSHSLESVMNFVHDINDTINWNAIKGGKKMLAALKEPAIQAIRKQSPQMAKKFENFQHLYSRMKRFEKAVTPSRMAQFIDSSPIAKAVGYLAMGSTALLFPKAAVATAIGKAALGRVSAKLLTEPKWQNLHQKMLMSIKNNSPAAAAKLYQILKNRVKKESPKDYEEIDWDSLLQLVPEE